jgi:hypothetical protein
VGDLVNLEFDLLAKYTEKILVTRGLAAIPPPASGEKARDDRRVI